MEDLKQRFIEVVKEGAMENFSKDKELRPVLLTLQADEKGQLGLVCLPLVQLMNPEGKDIVAKLIQQARMTSPAVAMVSESWLVTKSNKPGEKIETDLAPMDDPDHIEVVNMMFYFGMESKMIWAEIIRPENGDPMLANWQDPGAVQVKGRFGEPPPSWN